MGSTRLDCLRSDRGVCATGYAPANKGQWLPNFNLLNLLFKLRLYLAIYLFISMIVLVNLMVAQMTTSFEAIKQASSVFRLFERVRTIIEYKDDTGLPSPWGYHLALYAGAQCPAH